MVSQKTWGDQIWTLEISKDAGKLQASTGFEKVGGGGRGKGYRMASYTS
jgi:hypothetical protein